MTQGMKKSERTRNRIIQTALALFDEQGIRHTTIPQICEKAQVSRSTFFHYFKTKGSILSEYRFSFADNLSAQAQCLPEGLSGKERVRYLLLFDARQNLEQGALLRQAIISSLDEDPSFDDSLMRTMTVVPPIYERVLQDSYPDADPDLCRRAALLITRVYRNIWEECVMSRTGRDFKQELSDSLDLMWDGFGFAE